MKKMTTIQIRIDQVTKVKAQKFFKSMGVSLSFAIKYYLTKVANAKNLKSLSDLDALILEMFQELKIVKARKEIKSKQYVSQEHGFKKLRI